MTVAVKLDPVFPAGTTTLTNTVIITTTRRSGHVGQYRYGHDRRGGEEPS